MSKRHTFWGNSLWQWSVSADWGAEPRTEHVLRRATRRLCRRAAVAVVLSLSASAAGAPVDWQLVGNDCPRLNIPAEIACGHYGRFYVGNVVPPASCAAIDQGSEIPPRYFPVRSVESFPTVPLPWDYRALGKDASRADPRPSGAATYTNALAPQAQANGLRRITKPWLTILDFSGAHGESVRWLAEAVAEQSGAAQTFWLDEHTDRTEVSDLDVVRQLCAVVERSAREPELRPIVNMSFGRPVVATDPVDGTPCMTGRLACQIQRVAQHLVARHGVLVGSAGVQREWLFPGALPEVISAGMLDTSAYLADDVRRAAWEMPVAHKAPDALMPGNSLCLRGGWAAPSGASYATAVTSGWFLRALTERAGLRLWPGSGYAPMRAAASGCHVLANGDGRALTSCAAATEYMFEGLNGGFEGFCWTGEAEPNPIRASLNHVAQGQPVATGAVHWQALVRPTPEGDPCVPCTSSNLARASRQDTATIAMGKQSGLRTDDKLLGVFLRLDDAFHEVQLSDEQLTAVQLGELNELQIAGAQTALQAAESASLFFSVREAGATTCDVSPNQEPACVWLSTPVHRTR